MAREKKAGGQLEGTESDFEALEKDVIERTSRTLSAIEEALAVYDAAKERPPGSEIEAERYRRLHEVLSSWLKRLLLSRDKSIEARKELLAEFISIGVKMA